MKNMKTFHCQVFQIKAPDLTASVRKNLLKKRFKNNILKLNTHPIFKFRVRLLNPLY